MTAAFEPSDSESYGYRESVRPSETMSWRTDPLPVTGPYPPLFAVMGAHGFAGTTSLAQMWAPAADTGLAWPANPATTQLVVVTARATLAGIRAAAQILRAAERGETPPGVKVCGLVVVAARPGNCPKEISRYAGTVAELVPHRYDVDWFEPLMCEAEPHRLPSWSPPQLGDPPTSKKARFPDIVPPNIAAVGQQICQDLAADHRPTT
jgi:hypothetical protein